MSDTDFSGLSLVGGRASLDFINTEGGERNGPPERLVDFNDLVRWSEHAGVIDAEAAARWLGEAETRPEEAARVHARAIELREALYRLFEAIAGSDPDPADLALLDREVAEFLARRRLVPAGGRFEWALDEEESLDRILWILVGDAADLLSSDALARVKACSGPDCSWLFLDESRNRSRRWCEMSECGNRAKQRRYQRRQRKASGTA